MRRLATYLLTIPLAVVLTGCAPAGDADQLYQTSTIFALLEGAYDGSATCGQLLAHGDLGLGTFDALDGEMVVLDGVVYKVRADGSVARCDDSLGTPFAAVTPFQADIIDTPAEPMDMQQLTEHIDSLITSVNLPWAIRIDGTFTHVKARSVPRQVRPYPRLADVVSQQSVFEFQNVQGTVVGFRMPSYAEGINVVGYHLHFITADRTGGGHVLELQTDDVTVQLDDCMSLHLDLPATADFAKADLTTPDAHELEQIER